MKTTIKIALLSIALSIWIPSIVIAEPYIAPYMPSVRQIIIKEATSYTIPPEKMLSIAKCESTYNPKAFNPKDVDGRPKYGLFQFDKDTFATYAPMSGIKTMDIWDPAQQAHTTAYMLSIKQDQWGCK
jgi:hypothetical protein